MDYFLCSDRWIAHVLKLYDLARIKLHGNANDLTDEKMQELMRTSWKELANLIEEK